MTPDDHPQETARPTGRPRLLRMAVVFVLVVAAAALLGRFGTDTGGGPAVDVEQSADGGVTG